MFRNEEEIKLSLVREIFTVFILALALPFPRNVIFINPDQVVVHLQEPCSLVLTHHGISLGRLGSWSSSPSGSSSRCRSSSSRRCSPSSCRGGLTSSSSRSLSSRSTSASRGRGSLTSSSCRCWGRLTSSSLRLGSSASRSLSSRSA